jgi:glycerol kinase
MPILAIDQGTSSSRVFIYDKDGQILSQSQEEFKQYFPQPGWVEHDPEEIWQSVKNCILKSLKNADLKPQQLKAIAITNQRETTIVWDKKTGLPVYNAIVWQSRQTDKICEQLKEAHLSEYVTKTTGLVIDSYFSGPKIKWILDHKKENQEKAEKGQLLFGTVDSWLLWKLTAGETHATDISNASRTMLFDIHKCQWDPKLLDAMNIPQSMLPQVKPSSGQFGTTKKSKLFDHCDIPICGIAGDQQAALYGQQCLKEGDIKNTYGTGCFMLMNTGAKAIQSKHGLITTIAWKIDQQVTYALEGSIFVAGSAIQWLRDQLEILDNTTESEAAAKSLSSNDGVYLVPAFVGLGAPYWQTQVQGAAFGITRGTSRAHLIRATLEAIAYQTRDLMHCMELDSQKTCSTLKVDGGATANTFLMQFQADLLQAQLQLPQNTESTILGAAMLAAKAIDYWDSSAIESLCKIHTSFSPNEKKKELMEDNYKQWQKAIQACISYSPSTKKSKK